MGMGDSVVDNVGAGGIVAKVDINTGIITSFGRQKNGKIFLKHPDTDNCIIGYQIPMWNELCTIIKKAALMFQTHSYISWDFALTEKGWIMVEANGTGEFYGPEFFDSNFRGLLKKSGMI